MPAVFTDDELQRMTDQVFRVLNDIGYHVAHPDLKQHLLKNGLSEGPSGRVCFDTKIIRDFVTFQEINAKKYTAPPRPPAPLGSRHLHRTSLGNMPSKYYDHEAGGAQVGSKKYLEHIARFAHADPRIRTLALPLSLTDVPAVTSPIEAFLVMAAVTDKARCHLEPFTGELIDYIAELADLFDEPPNSGHGIGPCICINPILKLEERSAGVMLAKAKYGVTSLMTSMPCAGGNAPVALDGVVVQGTAEIVGGLVISWLIEPDLNHRGYISSGSMDFKTATITQSSPDSVLIDVGVVQLMNHAFGGNTAVGGRTYVAATQPGLQAVYEKMFKTIAYQSLLGDRVYGGHGVLDNGSCFSPEQLILDLDVDAGLGALARGPVMGDDVLPAIAEVVEAGRADFMSHDHTLTHFREAFWEPAMFLRPGGSEADILARARQTFQSRVDAYQPPDIDEDKLRAGHDILTRARNALLH